MIVTVQGFRGSAVDPEHTSEPQNVEPLIATKGYVFTGYVSPIHSGGCVSGHFNDFAAGAFLPPPRSPAKNVREPRSPPRLSH